MERAGLGLSIVVLQRLVCTAVQRTLQRTLTNFLQIALHALQPCELAINVIGKLTLLASKRVLMEA